MTISLLLVVALLATGCGPASLIEVSVQAELEIPIEVDQLTLTVLATDSGETLSSDELALEEGQSFPLLVLYEPTEDLPTDLRHRAVLSLANVEVAATTVQYSWQPAVINEVVILLTP